MRSGRIFPKAATPICRKVSVTGKKEIVADKEAMIYRNFIKGASPRGIGVGYPEKANLVFDANMLTITEIWQGAFIDAAQHSSGRGEGFEPPLGDRIYTLPGGPPFAMLVFDERAVAQRNSRKWDRCQLSHARLSTRQTGTSPRVSIFVRKYRS